MNKYISISKIDNYLIKIAKNDDMVIQVYIQGDGSFVYSCIEIIEENKY